MGLGGGGGSSQCASVHKSAFPKARARTLCIRDGFVWAWWAFFILMVVCIFLWLPSIYGRGSAFPRTGEGQFLSSCIGTFCVVGCGGNAELLGCMFIKHLLSACPGEQAEARSGAREAGGRGSEAVQAAGAPECCVGVWGSSQACAPGIVVTSLVSRPAEDEGASLRCGTWTPRWTLSWRGGRSASWGCRHKGP